mmetsp:Transcript_27744/g.79689  ORF Transcript_27744/g.79689 Transcript_27744/m.79689 type:complete len:234 (+) Transcript_27744:186-887(+)
MRRQRQTQAVLPTASTAELSRLTSLDHPQGRQSLQSRGCEPGASCFENCRSSGGPGMLRARPRGKLWQAPPRTKDPSSAMTLSPAAPPSLSMATRHAASGRLNQHALLDGMGHRWPQKPRSRQGSRGLRPPRPGPLAPALPPASTHLESAGSHRPREDKGTRADRHGASTAQRGGHAGAPAHHASQRSLASAGQGCPTVSVTHSRCQMASLRPAPGCVVEMLPVRRAYAQGAP